MANITTRASKGSALTWAEGDQNLINLNNDKVELTGLSALTFGDGSLTYNSTTGQFTYTGPGTSQYRSAISVTATGGDGSLSYSSSTGVITYTGPGVSDYRAAFSAGTGITITNGVIASTITDTNTTYGISAETVTGGVNLRLSGSNSSTDDVKFAQGSNITLTRTDANTITIDSTATGGITVSNDTTTNATRYIVFEDITSGTATTMSVSSTKLTYNPSSGTLSSTSFSGIIGAESPNVGYFSDLVLMDSNNLRFYDADSSQYVGFKAPDIVTANKIWTLPAADGTSGQVLTTNGTGTLSWATVSGGGTVDWGTPGTIGSDTANTGKFTSLEFKYPVQLKFTATYAATFAPNVASGSVQEVTLTGNITINNFTSAWAGQSLTLIIKQDATGGRTLSSTMKFSGGNKTLSTAANAVDIMTIHYDGTTYWASLGKDFK